jgi:hypothetical protein
MLYTCTYTCTGTTRVPWYPHVYHGSTNGTINMVPWYSSTTWYPVWPWLLLILIGTLYHGTMCIYNMVPVVLEYHTTGTSTKRYGTMVRTRVPWYSSTYSSTLVLVWPYHGIAIRTRYLYCHTYCYVTTVPLVHVYVHVYYPKDFQISNLERPPFPPRKWKMAKWLENGHGVFVHLGELLINTNKVCYQWYHYMVPYGTYTCVRPRVLIDFCRRLVVCLAWWNPARPYLEVLASTTLVQVYLLVRSMAIVHGTRVHYLKNDCTRVLRTYSGTMVRTYQKKVRTTYVRTRVLPSTCTMVRSLAS